MIGVEIYEVDMALAYQLAERHSLSVYDAAYVTLAMRQETELWTADRRLFDAVSSQQEFVHWIGDWPR
ncbi:MAG TPA: type II toxin-antitoxin system VapC family toxin [Dehalococcoidia bacterium]|nr:type II toxin-antitoxin system VapC family toxin [Dehalococcoidia bacterium]